MLLCECVKDYKDCVGKGVTSYCVCVKHKEMCVCVCVTDRQTEPTQKM